MKRSRIGSKHILSFILAVCLCLSMIPITAAASHTDTKGHWASDVINEWTESGLANGYPDGTFRPDNPIKRAEYMVYANNAFKFTRENNITYKDVKPTDWYYSAVKKAVAAGYIGGYTDGTMRPEQPITRQEAAVIIAKIKGLQPNVQAAQNLKDSAQIPQWSKGFVGAVVAAGYMTGYPDGTFRAQNRIKRAEAITALNKAMVSTTVTPPISGGVSGGVGGGSVVVAVEAIGVDPTSMTLTAGGATGSISVIFYPANATNKNISWTTSDSSVATVSNGVVTPVAAGSAVIIATSSSWRGDKTASCLVTVNPLIIPPPPPPPTVGAIAITTDPADVSALAHDASVEVTLATATAGAEIRYTTDGSQPTATSTLYDPNNKPTVTNANQFGQTVVIKAIGIKAGMTSSSVAQKSIVFKASSTVVVSSAEDLQTAITDNSISTINITNNFAGNVTSTRAGTGDFTINFDDKTMT